MIKYNVPNSWKETTVGKVTRIFDGTHQTPDYVPRGVPFYSVEQLTSDDFRNTKFISEIVYKMECKRVKIEKDDILMTRIGDIGTAKHINWEPKASFYVSLALIKSAKDVFDSSYLVHYIHSNGFKRELWKRLIHVAFPIKINLGEISHCKIILPPLPEQKAIADLLSTWDEAIENTERLIQEEEKHFKWLLHSLISEPSTKKGTKWRKAKLANISKVKKGTQLNIAHMKENGEYYVLNGGINPSGRTDDWNVEAHTITISEGGNSCGYINYNTERFWSGGHCYSLSKLENTIDNHFLFYFLKLRQVNLMRLRVGSGLPNIQQRDIDNFKIIFPTIEEQLEIACTLLVAQQKIDTLKQLSEKYRIQKRGLMQRMLTGAWRVIPEVIKKYKVDDYD